MIYITRRLYFNATHKLWNDNWTPEENKRIFGPCANENWHGHNYTLDITLAGNINPETGYVMDLKEIKDIAEKHVLSKVDHKNLALDVDFMKGLNPTTEILAIKFWEILYPLLKRENASLYEITLYETERQWVSYKGE